MAKKQNCHHSQKNTQQQSSTDFTRIWDRQQESKRYKVNFRVINVTVSIIARSPHPTPKTALVLKAPRVTISSQRATAASPATAAGHSIKLVEGSPSNATGANASRSAVSIAVPTILPHFARPPKSQRYPGATARQRRTRAKRQFVQACRPPQTRMLYSGRRGRLSRLTVVPRKRSVYFLRCLNSITCSPVDATASQSAEHDEFAVGCFLNSELSGGLFQVTDTALFGQCLRRIENPIGVDVDKMPRFLDLQLQMAAPASSAPTKPFE